MDIYRYLYRYPYIDTYFSPEKHRYKTLRTSIKSINMYTRVTLADETRP